MIPQPLRPWRGRTPRYAHRRSQYRPPCRDRGRNFPNELVEHRVEEILAHVPGDPAHLLLILDQNKGRRDCNRGGERYARIRLSADVDTPQRRPSSLRREGIGPPDLRLPAATPYAARVVEHEQFCRGRPGGTGEEGGEHRPCGKEEPHPNLGCAGKMQPADGSGSQLNNTTRRWTGLRAVR